MNIKKGTIKNVVSQEQFEKIYKPNGWELDEETREPDEIQETVNTLKSEAEAKNYIKMKKRKEQHFTDALFYSDEENR